MNHAPDSLRARILSELAAQPVIDPAMEIRRRTEFLKRYLLTTPARGFVLGVSGGQDSSLTGRLVQLAIEELNAGQNGDSRGDFTFIAVRLPYGVQADEDDAQLALSFIRPERTVTVNIKPAVDASASSVERALGAPVGDFVKGNIKARERMLAQYAVAGQENLLVVGTDHAAEAITGFFTKHGDGATDLMPIAGLSKRQGRAMLEYLGAPRRLFEKIPTADLEEARPGLPDEEALGLSYREIDDYLEGRPVSDEVAARLERYFLNSRHKRQLPVMPLDTWWQE
ncbi:ammonia-dependent NAD(+) synthetase [Deinococcus peraridilitoris]|uniref:NH(3)-dependent NAD(+) synthetase n=1 Tax=Deinococcus peraridilitoris (strain DSM 19664 / LMG 22246 / CIP 109416 / KR-200) TaxID=937777 RepID=L0A6Z0_DEIPD|nr:ammonia-dependent NAD(+) synthetase [Deinococcus peraridilitoris]AFZ68820.1 NAD+ synthetase [Deinococcus peraridilitoris DSM 19664]